MQCGEPMENRRLDAIFCRQKCKRRYYRRSPASNYEPRPAGTAGVLAESRADATFRAQLASHQVASQPLTDEEHILLARQKRNPGPLLPELQQRLLDHEYERRRREEDEAYDRAIMVEDPLDPSSLGSMQRRASQSRRVNGKPVDPNMHALRPGQSGHRPVDDIPECIDAPWSRGR